MTKDPAQKRESDEALVRKALGGDGLAFQDLVERYFGPVYGIAYIHLKDREAAEDLAQETFLRAHLSLGQLRTPKLFSCWVGRIARNLAVRWRKKGQRSSELVPMVSLDDSHLQVPDPKGEDAREALWRNERNRAVRDAILDLPETEGEVVFLRFIEELSTEETAARLGINASTVRRRLKRGLATMRRTLEPVIRGTAPALRSSRLAKARALGIVAAAAGLSESARAALVEAAGGSSWIAAVSATLGEGAKAAGGGAGGLEILGKVSAAIGRGLTTTKGVVSILLLAAVLSGLALVFHAGGAGSPSGVSRALSPALSPTIPTATPTPVPVQPSSIPSAARPGGRVLRFPADRSVGTVEVRPEGSEGTLNDFWYWVREGRSPWRVFAQARGDVTIPPGMEVLLAIDQGEGMADPSALASLDPDDLYRILFRWTRPGTPKAGDSFMPALARLTGLKDLALDMTDVTEEGLQSLESLRSLETLRPPMTLSDAGLRYVARVPSIRRLYFRESQVTDDGLASLEALPGLRELTLGSDRITDAGLEHLAGLPHLDYLWVANGYFDDGALAPLGRIASLRILRIAGKGIDGRGLSSLAGLTHLEALDLGDTGVSDSSLGSLEKLPALRKLDLRGANIQDEGLATLGQIRTLEDLSLPNSGITDAGLAHLEGLPALRSLWVGCGSSSPITDAGLESLSRIKTLESLKIGGSGIGVKGVEALGRVPGLKDLLLTSWSADNSAMTALARFPFLETLHLMTPEVTVSGLNRLNALTSLRSLRVDKIARDDATLDLGSLSGLKDLSLFIASPLPPRTPLPGALRDRDLVCLEKLTGLERLNLGANNLDLTDAGLASLGGLTKLKQLIIGGQKLTDHAISPFLNMHNLESLTIAGKFTPGGLEQLGTLKSLTSLTIRAYNSLSVDALSGVQSRLPTLRIEIGKPLLAFSQ